jgi:hypothetical protein
MIEFFFKKYIRKRVNELIQEDADRRRIGNVGIIQHYVGENISQYMIEEAVKTIIKDDPVIIRSLVQAINDNQLDYRS